MMRALLYSCILLSTYTQATLWQELKERYSSKEEAVEFLSLCVCEARREDSKPCLKELAQNIGNMAINYDYMSPEWETLLIVFDVFLRENKQHPMELQDLLKDQDLFIKRLKERLSFLFECGPEADSPKTTKR